MKTEQIADELWRYSNAPIVKRAIARLEALQRVADAASALTDANREKLRHGRASRQEVQLEGALRALDEPATEEERP